MQSPTPGTEWLLALVQAEEWLDRELLCRKGSSSPGEQQAEQKPAVHFC